MSELTTDQCLYGEPKSEYDKALRANVALFPHGQLWHYIFDIRSWVPISFAVMGTNSVITCTASKEHPPLWTPM